MDGVRQLWVTMHHVSCDNTLSCRSLLISRTKSRRPCIRFGYGSLLDMGTRIDGRLYSGVLIRFVWRHTWTRWNTAQISAHTTQRVMNQTLGFGQQYVHSTWSPKLMRLCSFALSYWSLVTSFNGSLSNDERTRIWVSKFARNGWRGLSKFQHGSCN